MRLETKDTQSERNFGPSQIGLSGSPFPRVTRLLEDQAPGKTPIDLGLGEPRGSAPDFVASVLADSVSQFGKYPPIRGTEAFRDAVYGWLARRYGLNHDGESDLGLLPLNGSREGLFYALFGARRRKPHANYVFSPNPFYQTYAAAAEATGCTFLSVGPEPTGLPDFSQLSDDQLANTVAVYVASPSNPQGRCAELNYWQELIALARRHDFLVFADECYSEIYRDRPPVGILEAAQALGTFDGVVSFNSLSKRSNLPGLRCGFMAGDPAFIDALARFRNMAAPQVPLPLQAVGARTFSDETHVARNRRDYNDKIDAAQAILRPVLSFDAPEGGFFLWLDCRALGSGEEMALGLWQNQGVRVIPGEYLTADEGGLNPGKGFIRVALVQDLETTREALRRMREFFEARARDDHPNSINSGA